MEPDTRVRIEGTSMQYREKDLLNIAEIALSPDCKAYPSQKGMVAIVFAAFALESYLNFLGNLLVTEWELQERKLSPKEKLKLIATEIGLTIDLGTRPFQSLSVLFLMRDGLAHAKPKAEEIDETHVPDAGGLVPFPDRWWLEPYTVELAQRLHDDVLAAIRTLHSAGGLGEYELYTVGEIKLARRDGEAGQ